LACNAEISLHLARSLGISVSALDQPFTSPFNRESAATLTKARNGDVVYRDSSLAHLKREFQTLPELAAALHSRKLRRLRPLLLALWRVRMLFEAGLIQIPFVEVPQLEPGSTAGANAARSGFELLIQCRWFLEAGTPVPFTRAFAEAWCPLEPRESRRAIYTLLQQGVIVKVDQIASNFRNATHLYLPGEMADGTNRSEAV
jgi:hypothetical protein